MHATGRRLEQLHKTDFNRTVRIIHHKKYASMPHPPSYVYLCHYGLIHLFTTLTFDLWPLPLWVNSPFHYLDLWPLDKIFSAMPTHIMNICGNYQSNPSFTKWTDTVLRHAKYVLTGWLDVRVDDQETSCLRWRHTLINWTFTNKHNSENQPTHTVTHLLSDQMDSGRLLWQFPAEIQWSRQAGRVLSLAFCHSRSRTSTCDNTDR